jgi:hypothetical protein
MDSVPVNIIDASREYDDLFELDTNSQLLDDSYTPYIWKASIPNFFGKYIYK